MAAIVIPFPAPIRSPTRKLSLLARLRQVLEKPKPPRKRLRRRLHGPVLFSEYGPGPRT